MILTAEYVSHGHPDRLCDIVVNEIVTYVISQDKDALCSLECAINTNKVFIDGRIAAGNEKKVIDKKTIKKIEAYEIDKFGTRLKMDDSLLTSKNFFSIECINNDLKLENRKIISVCNIK